MALDTRNKRASTIGVALAWRLVLPTPDGSAGDTADRLHVAACYAGIQTVTVAPRRLATTRASRTRTATPASEN